jgi:hypothetical protein
MTQKGLPLVFALLVVSTALDVDQAWATPLSETTRTPTPINVQATPPDEAIGYSDRDFAPVLDGLVGDAAETGTSGSLGAEIASAYRHWDRRDLFERSLRALDAPESAIYFDEILVNAKKERLDEQQMMLLGARVRANSRIVCARGATIDWFTWAFGGGALAAVAFSLAVVLYTLRSMRQVRAELAEKESALVLLAFAIKSAESRPWAGDLLRVLREALRERADSEGIRRLLRRHRELRLDPTRTPTVPRLDGLNAQAG